MEMEQREIRGVGYYPMVEGEVLGAIFCDMCWGNDEIAPITEYFEEVGVDSTYGYHHELDTPQHCDGCENLIKTGLTREGYYYILDYIFDPNCWNSTTALWVNAWIKEIDKRLIFGFGERR